ncbi:MAG: glycerol dehydrogenase [Gracilibacteraceae bacterium]|jgi:glycerol dehydrogenase|nr:glycerol dehydrogenase [Gracilibacteraceae bacterium]
MAQTFICLSKYVQGYDELRNLREHTAHLGKSLFVLISPRGMRELEGSIRQSFAETDSVIHFECFGGECTKKEAARLRVIAQKHGSDVVIGVGGGKVMDAARAVAYLEELPVVIVPTVASCDAPTSALIIYYTEDGVFEEKFETKRNPNVVLADTRIIAEAPVRLLVAGMGDALATYFEARTCVENCRTNYGGGQATLASLAIAKLCYETLLADGAAAKLAAENRVVTKALDNIIEANTLLSGIGFECNGSAAAHSMYSGFSTLPTYHDKYHGEWVAFGTIVLLVLENRPRQEIEEVIRFSRSVGLPTTFKDLDIDHCSRADLYQVAQKATAPKEAIHKEPFVVTATDVLSAMYVADALGRQSQV